MALPLMLLCLGSIFSGYIFKDVFVATGPDFFKQSIFVRGINAPLADVEFIPSKMKLLPTCFSLGGFGLAAIFNPPFAYENSQWYFYEGEWWYHDGYVDDSLLPREVSGFLSNKWYFDEIYNYYFAQPFLSFSYKFCFIFIDQYFLKYFGPAGVSTVIFRQARRMIDKQQSGRIDEYAFCMVYALLGCLCYVY
jgi:NADH-quinone oxidoreductase subunit L